MGWETIIPAAISAYGATKGGGSKQTSSTQVDPAQMAMYKIFMAEPKVLHNNHLFHTQAHELLDLIQINLDNFKPPEVCLKLVCNMILYWIARTSTSTYSNNSTSNRISSTNHTRFARPSSCTDWGVSTPQFRGLLGADIGAYQSPYTQQVIEQSMADIQRQADISRGQAQSRAIGAGAFGGSRSALLESESQRPFIEQMARTAAGLRESGFQQAQQAALSD